MKKHFIRNRKVRYGGITAILTVLIVTVTLLANAVFETLASRYSWYTSLNRSFSFEVSENTYTYLEEVFSASPESDIEIIFCDLEENILASATQRYIFATADDLATHFEGRIKITFRDILSNPTTVKQYATSFNPITGETSTVSISETSVILVADGYHRVYSNQEFFVFKEDDTSQLWAYNGERKLAAGIMRAFLEEIPVACITTNHGEAYYDYEFVYLLDDAGYSVAYIDLLEDEIPENCNLIISYNPHTDLIADDITAASETEILDKFLAEDGNSFLVFFDNETPNLPTFESYLAEWGISFAYHTQQVTTKGETYDFRYMVYDSKQSLTSDGYTIYAEPVTTGVMADFSTGLVRKTVFKNATAMKPAPLYSNNGDGSYTNGDRTFYSLYQSSDSSVSWAYGKPVSGDNAILMGVTEQNRNGATSYVGALSSVEFSTESFLQSAVYGNSDVLMRYFELLGNDNTPEGLAIKPFESTDISTLTTADMLRWTLALSITPAVVISAVAVIILVKRRNA